MSKKRSASLLSKEFRRSSILAESLKRLFTNPGAIFGLVLIIVFLFMMIYSFIFISFDDIMAINPLNRLHRPSAEFPFGTDEMGRSLFIRILYGSRYSLAIAFGSVVFGLFVGVFFGAIAGFYGGALDEVIMRASDVLASIPGLLLGLVLIASLGANLLNLLIAVGVSTIPSFVRLTRAAVMSIRGSEYMEAAKAIGMMDLRIIFTQALPNSISPLIVNATARMATSVLAASGLSFLGFGITAPLPEWGALISSGRGFIMLAPHLTYIPGIFIMAITLAFSLLGDGLRDVLDPRLKN